jgi:hypothetical protein
MDLIQGKLIEATSTFNSEWIWLLRWCVDIYDID